MRDRPHQTRLTDFAEDGTIIDSMEFGPTREPTGRLWARVTDGNGWCVCDFNGTVLFARIINNKLHADNRELFCKWCGGRLEIRNNGVYCAGKCGNYQGRISYDLDDYLRWNGARSFTLRREIAKIEGLELERSDLAVMTYAPIFDLDYLDEE